MRIENHSGRETCRMCDRGLAVVGTFRYGGHDRPEYGPCPFCELGERLEFPREQRLWPTWGKDGFWRGREPEVVPPKPDGPALPKPENALRMRLLLRCYGGEPVDPLVGIDIADPALRMALLERAVAR